MLSVDEVLKLTKNKTRVLLLTASPKISSAVVQILQFSGVDNDYFSADHFSHQDEHDFAVLQTSDENEAAQFQPTVVFISDEFPEEKISSVLKNITGGGAVIYPENKETVINSAENYFRKLAFSDIKFHPETKIWETSDGAVPLNFTDSELLKNLEGLRLLAQQFGIMEDDFYESVLNLH